MDTLYSLFLRIIHAFYALYLFAFSIRQSQAWTHPQPLKSSRRRTPKHLALVLKTSISHSKEATRSALVQSVVNAASWCREVGVQQLTVYEEHGLLEEYDQDIRSELLRTNGGLTVDSDSSESEVEYHPLTPPPSDYSDSRPISPSLSSRPVVPSTTILLSATPALKDRTGRKSGLRRRTRVQEQDITQNALSVSLISKDASKNAIAAAGCLMAKDYRSQRRKTNRSRKPFTLTVDELESLLEGEHGLSSPEFMIVHSLDARDAQRNVPLEFYNFPPWHMRLTEMHLSRLAHVPMLPFSRKAAEQPIPLDENMFREALDEYAGAEFRFGK